MASLEPMIRMNENAYRGLEKMQSKGGRSRKPLGDVTNSSKPIGNKDKSIAKNVTGFKPQQQKMQVQPPKAGRKPLGDLTNSIKPRANEKSSKKNCIENLSSVNEERVHSWELGEGFLHDHNECMKAQEQQSTAMSMDYFLEILGFEKEVSSESVFPPQLPPVATATKSKLRIQVEELELEEMMDVSLPSSPSPKSPLSPKSPCWTMEWKDLELSPLKLKESPARN